MKPLKYTLNLSYLLFLCNMLFYIGISVAEEKALPSVQNNQILTIEDLTRGSRATVEYCKNDIETYCQNVTTGEGRIFACLHAYGDKISESCKQALAVWEKPDFEPRMKNTSRYPNLEERELGTTYLDKDGERVIWDHPLPFLAQDVIDLGFDLPLPFGVAIVPGMIQQDLILDQLAISINNSALTNIDFVDFGTPSVDNRTVQLKVDAWIFPFLNMYATLGKLDGKAAVPISIGGSDLFPTACGITPNLPVCLQTFSAMANPDYDGTNVSLGITLAMGWKEYFFALPITYAWSEVSIIDTTVTALHISPRIGMTSKNANGGMLSVFIGATYLDAEVDLAGTVSFDSPGAPGGDITTVDYRINQRNKDKWNYLLGFNWDISKKWSFMLESGFGGSRQNLIGGATYRF